MYGEVNTGFPGHNVTRRIAAGSHLRLTSIYVVLETLIGIIVFVADREVSHYIDHIESWIAGFGPWSMLAFMAMFILATSLLAPETVMAILTGALFGLPMRLAVAIHPNPGDSQ